MVKKVNPCAWRSRNRRVSLWTRDWRARTTKSSRRCERQREDQRERSTHVRVSYRVASVLPCVRAPVLFSVTGVLCWLGTLASFDENGNNSSSCLTYLGAHLRFGNVSGWSDGPDPVFWMWVAYVLSPQKSWSREEHVDVIWVVHGMWGCLTSSSALSSLILSIDLPLPYIPWMLNQ